MWKWRDQFDTVNFILCSEEYQSFRTVIENHNEEKYCNKFTGERKKYKQILNNARFCYFVLYNKCDIGH